MLAANRLQKEIKRCIHANQYGFISYTWLLCFVFEVFAAMQSFQKEDSCVKTGL
jgi:hypothetical protein